MIRILWLYRQTNSWFTCMLVLPLARGGGCVLLSPYQIVNQFIFFSCIFFYYAFGYMLCLSKKAKTISNLGWGEYHLASRIYVVRKWICTATYSLTKRMQLSLQTNSSLTKFIQNSINIYVTKLVLFNYM